MLDRMQALACCYATNHTHQRKKSTETVCRRMTSAGTPLLLPTSQNDPSGLGRAEAFWNSFSCDPSIAVLQSVPAFLLNQASVGPRSSGEVVRQHASARSNQWFVNSFLCLNLFFAERHSYVHICGFNDLPLSRERRTPCYRTRRACARRSPAAAACYAANSALKSLMTRLEVSRSPASRRARTAPRTPRELVLQEAVEVC